MKKLLVMILMLGVSLPALANPIKLSCKVNHGDGEKTEQVVVGFDEADGTVLWWGKWNKVNQCTEGEAGPCDGYFIEDDSFGDRMYLDGKFQEAASISRMTGEFSRPGFSGTCVLFKQAF
jgi:hypothetical protein